MDSSFTSLSSFCGGGDGDKEEQGPASGLGRTLSNGDRRTSLDVHLVGEARRLDGTRLDGDVVSELMNWVTVAGVAATRVSPGRASPKNRD